MASEIRTGVARWVTGMQFEGIGGSGNTLTMGSSGESKGFGPMELLLVGLAGCTGMDVIDILRKKKQDVTAFEVRVSGVRADEYPMVYTSIDVEYVVTGRDISPDAVARAIELSESKYCSVSAMLGKTAEIKTSYTIAESEPAAG